MINKKLKIKVWYEFEKYNAQIPSLFLVGTGDNNIKAVQDLFFSYSEYVTDKYVANILEKDNQFYAEFFDFSELFLNTIKIQARAYNFTMPTINLRLTYELYCEFMKKNIPSFDKIIDESKP